MGALWISIGTLLAPISTPNEPPFSENVEVLLEKLHIMELEDLFFKGAISDEIIKDLVEVTGALLTPLFLLLLLLGGLNQ